MGTAQAAMRHSDPSPTANVYNDPKLLDVSGAFDALPNLPLYGDNAREQLRATGTETHGLHLVALTSGNGGQNMATGDKQRAGHPNQIGGTRLDVTAQFVKDRSVLTTPDTYPSVMGDTGLEPVTPSVSSGRTCNGSHCNDGSYKSDPAQLHSSLLKNASKQKDDPLAALIGNLTPEQRARLAAILAGQNEGGKS